MHGTKIQNLLKQKVGIDMKRRFATILFVFCALLGCSRDNYPAEPDWDRINPDPEPVETGNRVVAHRGGSAEAGVPDNSIAALKYAISLGCYGSECDVYWTSDGRIVVAHADGQSRINGLVTYEHTLAEIRAAGKLSNGEDIPTLEEYLDIAMESNTRLVIDIKRIDNEGGTSYVVKCAEKVCDLVKEKNASEYVILLCTGYNQSVMTQAWALAKKAGLEMAMNSGRSAYEYTALGFKWANLSAATQMGAGTTESDALLKSYLDAGIGVSVYNIDKRSGDGNAVYSGSGVQWYINHRDSFRMLCSNYPKWLLEKIKES